MRTSHRLCLLVALATPSLLVSAQDAGPICSRIVEEIDQFQQLDATQIETAQIEDALDAAKVILTSLMELQLTNRGGESVARNCPKTEQQEIIQQYLDTITILDDDTDVDKIAVGEIVVTGTRRGVSTFARESDNGAASSDWRPFNFEGRTFYFVPLAND